MRTTIALAAVLLALVLMPGTIAGPGTIDGENPPHRPGIVTATAEGRVALAPAQPPAQPLHSSNDILEVRFLLLRAAAANGVDLRLKHVLGAAATDAAGRFFTVAEEDPETLVERLGALGTVEVLDRANLPLTDSRPSTYHRGMRLRVPQVEQRNEQSFTRWKYEDTGTKLLVTSEDAELSVKIEVSTAIAWSEGGVFPLIGTAAWQATIRLMLDRTAVFRSHWHLPPEMLGPPAEGPEKAPRPAKGCTLIVLLTRSRLP